MGKHPACNKNITAKDHGAMYMPAAPAGSDVSGAMKKGVKFGVKYYQPKVSKNGQYAGLPRFNAKDDVQASANGLGTDNAEEAKTCVRAKLKGANALVAGTAIALAAVALF